MKVACIGNMNNNMFCLVRYLRDQGIDAEMLLLSHEQQHFLPDSDSYADTYTAYTRRLTWGSAPDFAKTPSQVIANDLAPYHMLLACNYAPAFIHKAQRRMDIFLPHGSDYYDVPFETAAQGVPSPLASAQLEAIRNAAWTFIPKMNQEQDRVWERIAPRGNFVHLPVPIIYTPQYSPQALARHTIADETYRKVAALAQEPGLLVFHHTRHCWTQNTPATEHKGNDLLLRGLARHNERAAAPARLVTFEYGGDVPASKRLANELGLAEFVHWMPRMPRKQIMPLLALSHLVATEFAYSWICGGVLYEALCMAKPVLCRRDDEYYQGMRLYPALRATTANDITMRLDEFAENPQGYAETAAAGKAWLEDEVLRPSVDRIASIIHAQAQA